MADAMALCTAVQVLGNIAYCIFRPNPKYSPDCQSNKKGVSQRSQFIGASIKRLGKKKVNKVSNLTGATKTKLITNNESKGEGESPKIRTKRTFDTLKDLAGSKKQHTVDDQVLKLQREDEALKKQLGAEHDARLAADRRVEEEVPVGLKVNQENGDLQKRLRNKQEGAAAQQSLLEHQVTNNIVLQHENRTLGKRLYSAQQDIFTEQRVLVQQAANIESTKKILSDGHDHAQALLSSKQEELCKSNQQRVALQHHLEEIEERAKLLEETAAQQIANAEQAARLIINAEEYSKKIQEKLGCAEAQLEDAQAKILELETEAEENRATIEAHEKKLQYADSAIAHLSMRLEDEEQSSKYLGEENENLQADLAHSRQLRDLNDKLQKKMDSMEVEIKSLRDSLDISESDALQAMTNVDSERAENNKLTEQLKEAHKRIKKYNSYKADFNDMNVGDHDDLCDKLFQALQQVQYTQDALREANERLNTDHLIKIYSVAQIDELTTDIHEKSDWIENLEDTVFMRDSQLNELKLRIDRMLKLVGKNMVDWTEDAVEEERSLRERSMAKNMQDKIPSCDYLFWEFHAMKSIAKRV